MRVVSSAIPFLLYLTSSLTSDPFLPLMASTLLIVCPIQFPTDHSSRNRNIVYEVSRYSLRP
jgi:hypothetical protein